jgi:hypothetical protein
VVRFLDTTNRIQPAMVSCTYCMEPYQVLVVVVVVALVPIPFGILYNFFCFILSLRHQIDILHIYPSCHTGTKVEWSYMLHHPNRSWYTICTKNKRNESTFHSIVDEIEVIQLTEYNVYICCLYKN